jgi:hypothetical protein
MDEEIGGVGEIRIVSAIGTVAHAAVLLEDGDEDAEVGLGIHVLRRRLLESRKISVCLGLDAFGPALEHRERRLDIQILSAGARGCNKQIGAAIVVAC